MRIISLLIIMMFVVSLISSVVLFATNPPTGYDMKTTIGGVTAQVNGSQNTQLDTTIKTLGSTILYVVRLVGTVLGVLLIIWFGIKWMTAAPQARAQLKDQAWNYVIGAFFLIGAIPLAQMVYNLITQAVK
jgi:hypothetical protein